MAPAAVLLRYPAIPGVYGSTMVGLRRRTSRAVGVLVLIWANTGPAVRSAYADDEPLLATGESAGQPGALELYQLGLDRLNGDDLAGAAEAFAEAYRLEANREVLYSLGLVYIRLNQPLQAIDALERYLADTAIPMAADRERVAREQLAQQQARVAFLAPRVAPTRARVSVDGVLLASRPDARLALNPGAHDVRVEFEGYEPQTAHISLAPGEVQTLELTLAPSAVGTLDVACPVPDVQVWLDDSAVGTTPLGQSLQLPVGEHQLRLTRPGYVEQRATLSLVPAETRRWTCQLRIDPAAPKARLKLEVSEPGARLWLDGAKASADGLLPPGRHDLRVERPGFRLLERPLLLQAGEVEIQRVVLLPTDEYLAEYRDGARNQRLWSYVAAGAGVLLGAGAAGVYVWNDGRYDDYTEERDELLRLGQSGAQPSDYVERVNSNNQALSDVQDADAVVIGLTAAAGAAVITGVVLYLLGDDPYRYDALLQHAGD